MTGVRLPGGPSSAPPGRNDTANSGPHTMSSLKHPAVEAAERLSEGEDAQAILSRLSRAELIYVIAEIGGMEEFDADEAAEDIHGDTANANLTRDQIQAVAEFVAATVGDDE